MAAQPTTQRLDQAPEALPPMATLPGETVLASLNDSDREFLINTVTNPPEFMDHSDLHKRGAEESLFGSKAVFADGPGVRFELPEPVVDASATAGSAIPTLTTEQEQRLFLRLNYSRMRMRQILEKFDGRRLTARATRELVAWRRRAWNARSEIVRMNVPLVLAMAKRTRLHSIDFNELVSEGNMALLRSVDKFDCGRGFKFSTYSCRAILKSFSRVAMRASRYRSHFPTEFDPDLEQDHSLEERREEEVDDCVDELKAILMRNYADLTDVEQTVIRERFALSVNPLDGSSPKTLEEVGLIIGVTKERVRQIQNKALRKIRHALEERYLAA